MREFFRSVRFRVMLGVVAALLVIMIVMGILGGWASPQTSIGGAIITPIQKLSSSVSEFFDNIFGVWDENKRLEEENAQLKQQLQDLTSEVLDYEKVKQENEQYKEFLDLKTENPDYILQPALQIGRDPLDKYGSFTIDQGTLAGIAPHDPVITQDGLVGYIYEAAPTYATVMTILNPDINVGGVNRRTRDAGIVTGALDLAEQSCTQLTLLPRSSSTGSGDYIVTSGGGGVFPPDLLIGTVKEVRPDSQNTSYSAVVQPAADLENIKDVMVITSFNGQSTVSTKE